MRHIGIEPCPCGHPSCGYHFLTGIGSWYQGSGFTKKEAERIAWLINNDKEFENVTSTSS